MARPYANEMENLLGTISWVNNLELFPLFKTIEDSCGLSMLAVGSGGSLSAAVALSDIHQHWTGQISVAATALQAAAFPSQNDLIVWLLSASGNNVDIMSAFNSLVVREPRKLSIISSNPDSKLSYAAKKHPFTDIHIYKPLSGKDGFLATNSLLAYVSIFIRAYINVFSSNLHWEKMYKEIYDLLSSKKLIQNWREIAQDLLSKNNLIVLYDMDTRPGAFDIESKFTEAALGNVQLADTRNFAHGRHHWLAKRGDISSVLSLSSRKGRRLAERTINLIPKEIKSVSINLSDDSQTALLISIIFSLHIAQWAGEMRGIDPGRPGVPDFGRKIYSLSLQNSTVAEDISLIDQRSIERKTHEKITYLRDNFYLEYWEKSLLDFKKKISSTSFQAIIFDYDGTFIDTRYRFSLPDRKIIDKLSHILNSKIKIGFATGRGKSIRESLQSVLPQAHWNDIFIGYYNGSSIGMLSNETLPHHGQPTGVLKKVAKKIHETYFLKSNSNITVKKNQISLSAQKLSLMPAIFDATNELICRFFPNKIKAVCSGHSIDIISYKTSKRCLVEHLKKVPGIENILIIGDQGRWPGNDHEILLEPCALSVDTVNSCPDTCWNIGLAGQRGVATTLYYLDSLQLFDGYFTYSCEE